MTKIMLISALTAVTVMTASAGFSFGEIFKDIQDTASTMGKDASDSLVSIKEGVVEISKSAERTANNLTVDLKDSSEKVSDVARDMLESVSNTSKEVKEVK